MKQEISIDKLGEILTSCARAANRETISYYGSDRPEWKSRQRLLSQAALVRALGIPLELSTDGNDGKELYTAISIGSATYTV